MLDDKWTVESVVVYCIYDTGDIDL